MVVFLFILVIALFLLQSVFANRLEVLRFWSKGLIPPRMSYTPDNLTLVYIALAGVLVKEHAVEKHQKLNFLYKFILHNVNKDYPEAGRNEYYQEIKNSLLYSIKHPVRLESAGKWLNGHKISDGHKVMVLKFMADLAYVDKQIHPREMAVIKEFSKLLSVSERQLNAIVSPLREDHEKRARAQEQERKETQQKTAPKASERERCCAILGVSKEAQLTEIKRSYRKLVLMYHPDKFVNASPAEYNAAQKKFLEIQSAYEVLEKLALLK